MASDLTNTNHGYHTNTHSRPKSILISKQPNNDQFLEVNEVYHKLEKVYKMITSTVGDEQEIKIEDLIVKNIGEFYLLYGIRQKKKEEELQEAQNLLQSMTSGKKKFSKK
jgi:hypothetical protein